MSRFLLLFLFLIWFGYEAQENPSTRAKGTDLAMFFGFSCLLVGTLGVWSRLLARRIARDGFARTHRYFNRVAMVARFFVPIWFAVGVFFLGWGAAVQLLLGPLDNWPIQLPGTLLGTLPALLTWLGLWWAQYPADTALREQSMLVRLDNGEEIYRGPTLWEYLVANLRLQVLFAAVPIFLILTVDDAIALILWRGFGMNLRGSSIEGLITFLSAVTVFIIVPEVLVRIIPTQPLPNSPMRERMEAMCRAQRLRFRDILLWHTHHRVANALVMGVVPRFRYVLLSDLLLAEMTDEQIEAVFAHELGHVVHRHLIWYLVFLKILVVSLAAVTVVIQMERVRVALPAWMPLDLVMTVIGFGGFVIALGFVSRRFERQADVFAARTLERDLAEAQCKSTHVGPLGASVFSSALERVALINNMSLESTERWEGGLRRRLSYVLERLGDISGNWLHGSIPQRMRALHHMSADPIHTHRFDRRMTRLYIAMIAMLLISGALAWQFRGML